jgi:polar amino acid transport system substrate-binding protein
VQGVPRCAFLAVVLLAGCYFPDDPDGTLDRVQNGRLRAGLSAREPWTRVADGKPAGPEARLVEDFAAGLNAQIDWTVGSESDLLAALEKRDLDLVVGGLTDDTPWRDRVGLTNPYLRVETGNHTEKHVIAVAPGENRWLLRLEECLRDQGDRVRREAGR